MQIAVQNGPQGTPSNSTPFYIAGAIGLASVIDLPAGAPGLTQNVNPTISGNGRLVAFASTVRAGNSIGGGVFVRDTCWGDVAGCLPSTNEAAALLLPDASVVSESRNGRYVVYSDRNAAYLVDSCLTASGWVPGCAPTSSTSPVMVSVDNAGNPCSAVGSASVSDDGHVAFELERRLEQRLNERLPKRAE